MSHFYNKDGKPVYHVPNKKQGGMRPTTIADAKKLKLYPSVTTVIALLDKPGIKFWERQQLLEAMQTIPFTENMTLDKWYNQCLACVDDKKGQQRGNEIHDKFEKAFTSGGVISSDIQPALDELETRLLLTDVIAEGSFGSILGFGGKVDLHSKTEDWIVDFKTKNKDIIKESELHLDDYIMQLAAYRMGLDMPNARCYNLFVSTINPEEVLLMQYTEGALKLGWEKFECLLKFWRLKNGIN
jgi:hypothetical protein